MTATATQTATAVTVYSKPNCVQCVATLRALNRQGIDHTVIDITQDENAYTLVKGLGYSQAPVVIVRDADQAVTGQWSGFHPDEIKALAA